MTTNITLWRRGFQLMTEHHATREGVHYKTEQALGDHRPCEGASGVCAFVEGDCHGVPCTPHSLRQFFPLGTHVKQYNVVWIKDASPT